MNYAILLKGQGDPVALGEEYDVVIVLDLTLPSAEVTRDRSVIRKRDATVTVIGTVPDEMSETMEAVECQNDRARILGDVEKLLRALDGAWWLDAAAAWHRLKERTHWTGTPLPQEDEHGG